MYISLTSDTIVCVYLVPFTIFQKSETNVTFYKKLNTYNDPFSQFHEVIEKHGLKVMSQIQVVEMSAKSRTKSEKAVWGPGQSNFVYLQRAGCLTGQPAIAFDQFYNTFFCSAHDLLHHFVTHTHTKVDLNAEYRISCSFLELSTQMM